MPRKKTIQPAPLKVYDYGDLTVDVVDEHTCPIGRGQDKVFKAQDIPAQALLKLAEMRDSSNPKDQEKAKEFLEGDRMETALARQLARWGFDGEERTLRRYAKSARSQWVVFRSAMEKAGIDPWS